MHKLTVRFNDQEDFDFLVLELEENDNIFKIIDETGHPTPYTVKANIVTATGESIEELIHFDCLRINPDKSVSAIVMTDDKDEQLLGTLSALVETTPKEAVAE
ncbi:hypothetical protein VQ643_14515 [Pseudomonas sp. F1_0610]|uniref:hypothetical protein n=1 Tax=Pseudomonas sp. F1_0610 TaxID=3114284 RepID=UPI0039C20FAC